MASWRWSSSASVVSCQWRVVASLEQGKRSRSAIMASDEVALPRGAGGDEGLEAEASDHRQDRFDVAMGPGAEGAEGLGGGDEGLALEGAADQVDDVDREVGEVAEGLVLDLAVLSDRSVGDNSWCRSPP